MPCAAELLLDRRPRRLPQLAGVVEARRQERHHVDAEDRVSRSRGSRSAPRPPAPGRSATARLISGALNSEAPGCTRDRAACRRCRRPTSLAKAREIHGVRIVGRIGDRQIPFGLRRPQSRRRSPAAAAASATDMTNRCVMTGHPSRWRSGRECHPREHHHDIRKYGDDGNRQRPAGRRTAATRAPRCWNPCRSWSAARTG